MNRIQSIRNNQGFKEYFSLLIFLTTSITVMIQLISAIFISGDGLLRLVYFTIQSNLLISVILGLFVLKKPTKIWFSRLAFIGLINISITGVVFHILLTPYMSSLSFMQHMLHTINPILYIIFYFIFFTQTIALKESFISLIYPLCYILFVFGFVSPVLGSSIESNSDVFDSSRYIYPFLNPDNFQNGFRGLLLFNLGILAPTILLFSILLQFLKRKLEYSLNEKETSQ